MFTNQHKIIEINMVVIMLLFYHAWNCGKMYRKYYSFLYFWLGTEAIIEFYDF